MGGPDDLGRPLRALLAVALAVLVLVACNDRVTVAQLRTNQEAELLYPGSSVVGRNEQEAATTAGGRQNASVGLVAATDASAADIESFYVEELVRRGWAIASDNAAVTLGLTRTSELSARAWRKGDLVFRLGLIDPTDPRAPVLAAGTGPSIYRIDLTAQPPSPTRT